MKKSVRIIAVALVAAAVAVVAYTQFRPADVAAATTSTTATVTRRTLTSSVSSAGNIQSHQTADLAFGQSGTVKTINVSVGDKVKAGDVLGELDTTDLQLALKSAEVGLKNAQANLAEAQNPNTEADIANAKAQLASAQAAYDKVKAGPTASELATAQAQLASAKAAYDAAVKSAATSGQLASVGGCHAREGDAHPAAGAGRVRQDLVARRCGRFEREPRRFRRPRSTTTPPRARMTRWSPLRRPMPLRRSLRPPPRSSRRRRTWRA